MIARTAAALTTTVLTTTVLTAVAALAGTATAAAAAPAATQLTLTVAVGESPTPVARRTVLRCLPTGGSHPRAAAACTALRKVNGDFAKLNVAPGVCTMEYAPTTVTATGTWRTRAVRFQRTYSNACVLRTHAGPVYRF